MKCEICGIDGEFYNIVKWKGFWACSGCRSIGEKYLELIEKHKKDFQMVRLP